MDVGVWGFNFVVLFVIIFVFVKLLNGIKINCFWFIVFLKLLIICFRVLFDNLKSCLSWLRLFVICVLMGWLIMVFERYFVCKMFVISK